VRQNGVMTRLDATDWAILDVLQDDARTSNRDLATAVHVSPSTSSERVRALKADGVIRGYHADVAHAALGRHVQALTAITLRPPRREIVEAFRNWVSELPEIVGVFVVSGAAAFLLHVAVPDTDALYAFVIDRLTERAEVADVRTSVVYEHIRRPVLEPLGSDIRT
jgi:DNA-binding Lrp family transcriptional regulator